MSPLFWYVIAGLPGLVLFKVVSTMDSMVGYKTPRYLRFGWCGARLDDVMNYRAGAADVAGHRGRRGRAAGLLRTERRGASVFGSTRCCSVRIPAGAKRRRPARSQRRIVGPIWLNGVLVTDLWIGDASDPPLATGGDVMRALTLCVLTGLSVAGVSAAILRANWL